MCIDHTENKHSAAILHSAGRTFVLLVGKSLGVISGERLWLPAKPLSVRRWLSQAYLKKQGGHN